jgi:YD repeat-containing protein
LLTSVTARNGYTQTLTYNAGNQLVSVKDSYQRALSFTYTDALLNTVTTPDGLVLTYGYTASSTTSAMTGSHPFPTPPVRRLARRICTKAPSCHLA